jgi:hypothetical protein
MTGELAEVPLVIKIVLKIVSAEIQSEYKNIHI